VTPGAGCDSTRCVTCSDEAVPMRVAGPVVDGLAPCTDSAGRSVEVMTALVGPVGPGDQVLVHAGVALAVTDPARDVR
jgi:hydrogenase expression/formation protein HypC